ncbi:MAG: DNA/RNA nuclease SfsA [Firmicutes bacterium]|nr:DNA/RNA nuclease SfsA [Bacillota bacterium]
MVKHDLALVKYRGRLVSVDARLPNVLVKEATDRGELAEFRDYMVVKNEVKYGNSRLDLLLGDIGGNQCYLEAKSVTLVENGIARFPDAPTERGSRHLEELARAAREGHRAAVVFVVQREDARIFSPNDVTDPRFGATLRRVTEAGVEVYAYICRVTCFETKIIGPIPVQL